MGIKFNEDDKILARATTLKRGATFMGDLDIADFTITGGKFLVVELDPDDDEDNDKDGLYAACLSTGEMCDLDAFDGKVEVIDFLLTEVD